MKKLIIEDGLLLTDLSERESPLLQMWDDSELEHEIFNVLEAKFIKF